jgi:RNA-directed DNA polymerase
VRTTKSDDTQRAAPVAEATPSPQAADIRDLWWWVEHSVWTDRMLTRLEECEPTTKWFRFWDKVLAERNLQAAFWAVWRNDGAPGVDGQTVHQFDEHAKAELAGLREELCTRRYRRQPARRVWIPKPGTTEKRPFGIPTVPSCRVSALRRVAEPGQDCEGVIGFRS